jgi:hypothetical protein
MSFAMGTANRRVDCRITLVDQSEEGRRVVCLGELTDRMNGRLT